MAIKMVCGAECGIAVQGAAGALATTDKHWTTITGTPAIESTIVRSGSKSFKFPVNTITKLSRIMVSANTVTYARFYFYVTSTSPSAAFGMWKNHTGGGGDPTLEVTTGGVLRMFNNTGTQNYNGTLVANEWYGVELQFDMSVNPQIIDWRVWRNTTGWVTQTQVSLASGTQTMNTMEFGSQAAVTGPDLYIDDIMYGEGTTPDEHWSDTVPKGGSVEIYRPNADLAHSFLASGDFKYENTTNFAQSATDVWSHLDEADMTQTAEFISQNVTSAGITKYCYIDFAREARFSTVHAVMSVCAFRSSGTGANEINVRASDDGTNWTNLWGNWGATGLDISETANLYAAKAIASPPSGGSWTLDKVNGLRKQFGMSDDVSAVPYVCGLAFEVAWQELDKVPKFSPYPQLLAH